jgi:hypothetical protein
MIAEYLTRRDAEIYASELTQLYGPDVHFDVVGMQDPVFGDTVWYVLGTGTVNGQMFAQYAEERKQWHNAAAVMEKPTLPAGSNKETDNEHSQARTSRFSQDRLFRFSKGCALRLHPFPV